MRRGPDNQAYYVLGHKTANIRDLYTLGRKLGQGQFGTTYLCTEISTNIEYACKTISKRKLIAKEDVEDVRREIQIMHHLAGHKNIVTIKGAYEDTLYAYIVMELCGGGELFDRIIQRGHYSERRAAELTRIIVGVVESCHSLGVMHRDLKPENFLLVNKDDDFSLKAIDFGLSVFFKPGQIFIDVVGSPYYVAPEMILKHYGPEADVWTAGVILYILLSGVPPFWAETQHGVFDAVLKGHIDFDSDPWPVISASAKDLIRKMLCSRPSERLTAHEVLCHPWIGENGVAPDRALDPAVLSRLKQFSAMNKLKKMALRSVKEGMVRYPRRGHADGDDDFQKIKEPKRLEAHCRAEINMDIQRPYTASELVESREDLISQNLHQLNLGEISRQRKLDGLSEDNNMVKQEAGSASSRNQTTSSRNSTGFGLNRLLFGITKKGRSKYASPKEELMVLDETGNKSESVQTVDKWTEGASSSLNPWDNSSSSTPDYNNPDDRGSTELPDIYGKDENIAGTSLEGGTKQELEKVLLIPPLDLIDIIASNVSVIHTLDLSYTNIKSLPEFISKFVALRVFNLKGCQLLMELVPEIGKLMNLEEFDLEGTEIIYLPKEIAKLINLKSLKFTLCGCADQFQETKRIGFVIPRKAFSNLLQLNELSIDVNPHGDWWNTEVKTVIDDLHCLQELKILRLYIPTVDLFGYLIQHIKLLIDQDSVCFRFTVGHHERLVSRLPEGVLKEFDDLEKFKKGLKFTSGEEMSIKITNALQHMDAFLLERHWSINNLLEFGLKSTEKLKCCILSECNKLQTLIDTKQHPDYDGTVLGSLQHLSIHYMKSMQKIWRGPVKKGSLSNLKSLSLYTCVSLATVFKIDMLANLVNLEELRIEDCAKIKTLASSNFSESMSQNFLPKLKSMLLLELPNLRCISSGLSIAPKLERLVILYCPNLKKLSTILYCPNLKKLSTTEISTKELQVLKGTKGWWDALKWYESGVTEDDHNYLTSKFIPLREDGDLEEQFLRD